MSTHIIFVNPLLAQAPTKKPQTPAKKTQSAATSPASSCQPGQIWMFASGGLLLLLVGLAVYSKRQADKLTKKVKFEEHKNRDIHKKLKLAVETIRKLETNPDLVNSREFNLDYLRMRMEEEQFNFAIVNQIKIKVKQLITVALRPLEGGQVGIANASGRQIDEIFDVIYEMEYGEKRSQRVLFRVQIRLMKLPTQSTKATVTQIIECLEKFLSLSEEDDTWQPTIQGRLAIMDWDQKAKPTPLLVLSQSGEGANVTFRTNRVLKT